MAKGTAGFFDVDERLADLSAKGDDLERVNALVDFEIFRAPLEAAVPRGDRSPKSTSIFQKRASKPMISTIAPVRQPKTR